MLLSSLHQWMARWGYQSRNARHDLRRRHEVHPFAVLGVGGELGSEQPAAMHAQP
jgi:hypothetical protein